MLKLIAYGRRGSDTIRIEYDGSSIAGECRGSYCMPDEWSGSVAAVLRLYEEARMLEDAVFNKYDVIMKVHAFRAALGDPDTHASLYIEYEYDAEPVIIVTVQGEWGAAMEKLRRRILTAAPGRLPRLRSLTIYCEDVNMERTRRLWSRGCDPRGLLERSATSAEARGEAEELLRAVERRLPYRPLELYTLSLEVRAPGYTVGVAAGETSTSVRVEVFDVQGLSCRRCLEAGRRALRDATHLLLSDADYSLA